MACREEGREEESEEEPEVQRLHAPSVERSATVRDVVYTVSSSGQVVGVVSPILAPP